MFTVHKKVKHLTFGMFMFSNEKRRGAISVVTVLLHSKFENLKNVVHAVFIELA